MAFQMFCLRKSKPEEYVDNFQLAYTGRAGAEQNQLCNNFQKTAESVMQQLDNISRLIDFSAFSNFHLSTVFSVILFISM
jgi:hypothetical protein